MLYIRQWTRSKETRINKFTAHKLSLYSTHISITLSQQYGLSCKRIWDDQCIFWRLQSCRVTIQAKQQQQQHQYHLWLQWRWLSLQSSPRDLITRTALEITCTYTTGELSVLSWRSEYSHFCHCLTQFHKCKYFRIMNISYIFATLIYFCILRVAHYLLCFLFVFTALSAITSQHKHCEGTCWHQNTMHVKPIPVSLQMTHSSKYSNLRIGHHKLQ